MAALTDRNRLLIDQALAELARHGGPMTTRDVAINLAQEGPAAERDVWRALDRLADRGLIRRLPRGVDDLFVTWQINHQEGTPLMPRAERADEWNAAYPIGTPVNAYPGSRDGRCLTTMTRSTAWTLPTDPPVAVVLVEGHSGGIALTHVDPVELDTTGSIMWSIANGVRTTLPNGRTLYQRTGGALSVRCWPDGRVEAVNPMFLVVGDEGLLEVVLACARCKVKPVPPTWGAVRMCDECLAAATAEWLAAATAEREAT